MNRPKKSVTFSIPARDGAASLQSSASGDQEPKSSGAEMSKAAGVPAPSAAQPAGTKSIVIMLFQNFLSSLCFSIVLPSLWPLLCNLGNCDEQLSVGWAVAVNSAGSFVSSPILGWWNDRRTTREVMIFSLIVMGLGNLVYALCDMSIVGLSKQGHTYVLMAARFVVGFAAGNFAVIQTYFSYATTPDRRTQVMAWNSGTSVMGFIVGPAFAALFSYMDVARSFPIGSVLDLKFNKLTWPGYFSALIALLGVVSVFFVDEVPRGPVAAADQPANVQPKARQETGGTSAEAAPSSSMSSARVADDSHSSSISDIDGGGGGGGGDRGAANSRSATAKEASETGADPASQLESGGVAAPSSRPRASSKAVAALEDLVNMAGWATSGSGYFNVRVFDDEQSKRRQWLKQARGGRTVGAYPAPRLSHQYASGGSAKSSVYGPAVRSVSASVPDYRAIGRFGSDRFAGGPGRAGAPVAFDPHGWSAAGPDRTATIGSYGGSGRLVGLPDALPQQVPWLPASLCLFTYFSFCCAFTVFETVGTVYTKANPHLQWKPKQNGLFFCLVGAECIVGLVLLQICQRFIGERVLLIGGTLVIGGGFAILIDFVSWVPLPLFYIGVALVSAGYSVSSALLIAVYSKVLEGLDQGAMMGWLSSSAAVARMVGPLLASYAWQYETPKNGHLVFVVMGSLLGANALLLIACYRLLRPRTPPDQLVDELSDDEVVVDAARHGAPMPSSSAAGLASSHSERTPLL